MTDGDARDGEVPRLPRGRWFTMSTPALFRIAMVGIVLAAVLGLRRQCADGLATFVTGFDSPIDAGPRRAAEPPLELERLTDEQIRERFTGEPTPTPTPAP